MKVLPKADWLEEFSYGESERILMDFAWSHAKEAGPFSDVLCDMLRRRDWISLCNYELRYDGAIDSVHYKHARQALAFFQKWESLDLGLDKNSVALEKFVEAEKQCRLTNETLYLARKGDFCFHPYVNGVLYTARQKIAQVLGPVPSLADLRFGFGPGATTTTEKRHANWAVKLIAGIACSTNTVPLLDALAQQVPHWFLLHAHACGIESAFTDVEVDDGRLQFVPKSAKTMRSIIVEPVLNSFIQRGVGLHIRRRLKRVGVDLDDQSRNQVLAKLGSLDGSLATVDLSSASDTISRELVYELLPLDWASFLEAFRTSRVRQNDGTVLNLSKFSSMGNGFTFELESLIFWALSRTVLEVEGLPVGNLAVYGDDIVLPTEAYNCLQRVFIAVGFTINNSKSFYDGPFRESCGKDYFKGSDIRPYYQKVNVSTETLFTLHNFYMREFDFARAKKVRRYIHPSLYIFGPDGYGDGHLIGAWRPIALSKSERRRGWGGSYFETFQHCQRRLKRLPKTDWALPTYCIYMRQGAELEYDPMVVPGSSGFKRVKIYTQRQGIFL